MKFFQFFIFIFIFISLNFNLYANTGKNIKKIGNYSIIIERINEMTEGKITIYQDKKKVFEESEIGSYYYFGNYFDDSFNEEDPMFGKNITGNMIPNLVISQWTGGAHCCNYLTIFELGKTFRKLVTVSAGSHGVRLIDLDKDKIPEIEFWDWPIDYIFTSFSESAQGKTLLKFENNHYRVASALMRTSAPKQREINKIENKLKLVFKKEAARFPYLFLKTMMDLSYSGHIDLAFKIADGSWPSQSSGLSEFKLKFKERLNDSEYWKEFIKY